MDVRHRRARARCRRSRVVVGDVLYGYTPTHKTFAVNAATGAPLWTFDSGIKGSGPNRGVMYWQSGSERRVFAAVDNFIYALDAATGKPIATFGTAGRIDLRENLGRDPQDAGRPTDDARRHLQGPDDRRRARRRRRCRRRRATSAPTTSAPARCAGRSTRFRIPASPATRPGRRAPGNTAAAPTTGPAWRSTRRTRHRLRADRIGGDRFLRRRSSRRQSLRQLPARAGRRDREAALALPVRAARPVGSRPAVAAEPRDRPARRPARSRRSRRRPSTASCSCSIARTARRSFRSSTGRSRPAPCRVKSRRRDQPLPTKPAPFARQRLTADLLTNRTPDGARVGARAVQDVPQRRVSSCRSRSTSRRWCFPGYDGGAEWGGQAFDPETGLYYVNANDLAWTGAARAEHRRPERQGALPAALRRLPSRRSRSARRRRFPSLVGDGDQRKTLHRRRRRSSARAPAGCPAFPQLEQTAVNAIVQFVADRRGHAGAGRGGGAASASAAHPLINNDLPVHRLSASSSIPTATRPSRRRGAR